MSVCTQKAEHARSSANGGDKYCTSGSVNANAEDVRTRLVAGDGTWLHRWDTATDKECPGPAHPTYEISYPTVSRQCNGHGFWGVQRITNLLVLELQENTMSMSLNNKRFATKWKASRWYPSFADNAPVHKRLLVSASSIS